MCQQHSKGDALAHLAGETLTAENAASEQVILATLLPSAAALFRLPAFGVELELQQGSLEREVARAVTVTPSLGFVRTVRGSYRCVCHLWLELAIAMTL